MITDLRSDYVYRGPNIMWGATVVVSSNQDFGKKWEEMGSECIYCKGS